MIPNYPTLATRDEITRVFDRGTPEVFAVLDQLEGTEKAKFESMMSEPDSVWLPFWEVSNV